MPLSKKEKDKAMMELFDFYMAVLEDDSNMVDCPFTDMMTYCRCHDFCMDKEFFNSETCPCVQWGADRAFQKLEQFLKDEGYIMDEKEI